MHDYAFMLEKLELRQ